MTSGIYCITNIKNGKKYIGQSLNINKRLWHHKSDLKNNKHINKHLQSSYNKYGADNFIVEILAECPPNELDKLERKFIKKYDTTNQSKGYNHEHGGTNHKKISLHSKIKRRGKWSHSINPKSKQNYSFRNMCPELWNTTKNYSHMDYSNNSVKLKLEDINKNKTSEDYSVEINDEETNMTDYERLINKYYAADGKDITANFRINKAEKVSNEFNRKLKKDSRRKHRHLILDELLIEIPFHLTNNQVTQIRYWIDRFNDSFKDFHRTSSNETIILAFIMIQRKWDNPKLNIERYSISKKYHLTKPKFINIQNRLIFKLMQTTELRYILSKYHDHEILVKEGR